MTGNHINRYFLVIALFTIRPLVSIGNNGVPHHQFQMRSEIILQALIDSLPENKTSPDENSGKDQIKVIKEVPKSHKQIKPIAVPAVTPIQPLKIIKPKIIKPIIRIH
ncbi:MAG TPA: hypothetical protein VGZ90_04310 [Puia sp.]|jgi:hypothetical protein|nr:hypothetical protein [Puia sp.]